MEDSLDFISENGKGRAFIIICEKSDYLKFCDDLSNAISKKARSIVYHCPEIDLNNWEKITDDLLKDLESRKIRQASYIGLGTASVITQNLCLKDIKRVRSLVQVDASTRAHPNLISKIIDQIESILPLGLPFRFRNKDFDSKPFLQRLRCPVLLLNTDKASSYILNESKEMLKRIPTSWYQKINDDKLEELCDLVIKFQDIPAKCPQKNLVN